MSPAVSVLMPVRNEEAYLAQALRSLLSQSFEEFEIVLVDDGSTDSTPDQIQAFAQRDARIRAYRNPSSLGVTSSLNRALGLAEGAVIARLDGDDIARPDRIARQLGVLESHPDVGLVGIGVALIDAAGAFMRAFPGGLAPHAFRWTALAHAPIVHSTAMFRTGLARAVGGYDPNYPVAQDFDLWCRLLHKAEGICLPGVGVRHRVHVRSVSATRLDEQLRSIVDIALRHATTACLREARVEDSNYRAFLNALHGRNRPETARAQTRAMLDRMVAAFCQSHSLGPSETREIDAIAGQWLDAATCAPSEAAGA
ncbi:MAG: glycosyltransferase family A protein [Pseudomonadota bacterium]